MKYKYLFIPILFIISYEVLSNSTEILNTVNFSFNIWKNSIFPSLFPFFIISHLFINYGMVELLGELLKPLMRLFKINNKCSFIFIMSILSGFPSSAIYTKKLYDEGEINEYDASKTLTFSHFSNPLFILGTLSIFLNDKKIVILILIIHYLTNIIIGLIFRGYHPVIDNSSINFKLMINNINTRISNNKSFGYNLTKAITTSIDTLLTILGTVTVFLCLTTILNNIFNFTPITKSIINGIFEMTQGLKYVSLLKVSLKIKSIISIILISFGGLSIHMQIISIISNTKIKYYPYLIARILHAIISSILLSIFYNLGI